MNNGEWILRYSASQRPEKFTPLRRLQCKPFDKKTKNIIPSGKGDYFLSEDNQVFFVPKQTQAAALAEIASRQARAALINSRKTTKYNCNHSEEADEPVAEPCDHFEFRSSTNFKSQ